jgi:hypothetical protein
VTEPRGTGGLKQPPQKIDVAPRVASADEEARLAKAAWILRRNNLDICCDEVKEQEQFALRIRDDVSKLSGIVNDIRTIRKQLQLHEELLAKAAKAKAYRKRGQEVMSKLNELEEKLHNPKAKVTYDILAQKGGAKLYSQLVSLMVFASSGDGPPTQGMKDLADDLEKELGEYDEAFGKLKAEGVVQLNELARKLNVPMIWIPARPK